MKKKVGYIYFLRFSYPTCVYTLICYLSKLKLLLDVEKRERNLKISVVHLINEPEETQGFLSYSYTFRISHEFWTGCSNINSRIECLICELANSLISLLQKTRMRSPEWLLSPISSVQLLTNHGLYALSQVVSKLHKATWILGPQKYCCSYSKKQYFRLGAFTSSRTSIILTAENKPSGFHTQLIWTWIKYLIFCWFSE